MPDIVSLGRRHTLVEKANSVNQNHDLWLLPDGRSCYVYGRRHPHQLRESLWK